MNFGNALLEAALTFLFPPRCPACRRYAPERGDWCEPCLLAASHVRRLRLTPAQRHVLAGAYAFGYYEGAIRELLRGLKYRGAKGNARYLDTYLQAAGRKLPRDLPHFACAVPVPLHQKRERQRGYNQTELIFGGWLAHEDLPLERLLQRTRETQPQYSLSPEERTANVGDAFAVTDQEAVRGQNILLLDDIFTTGATATACAQALRKAGAQSVTLLALASGQK